MPAKALRRLADSVLSEKEIELGRHLAKLLGNDRCDGASLVVEILPKYWRKDNTEQTLEPREVYRPLYYLHDWADFWRAVSSESRDPTSEWPFNILKDV